MEDIQIGAFIRDRRLQLEMTQQQLADKLGVTDKAVSKWERSVSYPDITILRELADALSVSVSELLAGKRDPQPAAVPPEVEDVVLDTVSYAETARQKNGRWKFILFLVLSICCGTGALVCFIFFWITGLD
ncbi:MAG: helix-turn-helix domain-containing protein, partial [Oscillospiraceae bacterium]|nr:helix-turn-helix domain-containing protein [Oscillospiraceae bacterium]